MPQLPRKPRGLMIQSRYHMHVVASAPSPQRGSKWHRQALPSLERFGPSPLGSGREGMRGRGVRKLGREGRKGEEGVL